MNRMFTVEESNLICVFAGEGRREVIEDIEKALPYLEDEDMTELSHKVLDKLKNITDKEFSRFKFIMEEV